MIALIDNYDSFTWNLVHYLGELGAQVRVHRNDRVSVDEVLAAEPSAIVLSPGPRTPDDAGICLELVARAGPTTPILGVCLGHQAIAQTYGGEIVRAARQMHGKLSRIEHSSTGIFRGINGPFEATRYHSLTVEPEGLPHSLEITARTGDGDGVIMGLSHRAHPVHGVQFHPESIASEHGHLILRNFLQEVSDWHRKAA